MLDTILGSKVKMVQTFVETARVPVTVVNAGPCVVTHVRTEDKDGYWAVQLGFGERRLKNTSKPLQGHLKKTIKDAKAPRHLREVRVPQEPEVKVGDTITLSEIFSEGDIVQITGTSKGKGFAGGVKRWGFGGGSKTHGQSDRQRAPGSIGQGTSPGRVWKGKKMAGHMGHETVTVKNIRVIQVDSEGNKLQLSGPIPGISGGLLVIKRTSEQKAPEKESEAAE